jgi:hypothetical protein
VWTIHPRCIHFHCLLCFVWIVPILTWNIFKIKTGRTFTLHRTCRLTGCKQHTQSLFSCFESDVIKAKNVSWKEQKGDDHNIQNTGACLIALETVRNILTEEKSKKQFWSNIMRVWYKLKVLRIFQMPSRLSALPLTSYYFVKVRANAEYLAFLRHTVASDFSIITSIFTVLTSYLYIKLGGMHIKSYFKVYNYAFTIIFYFRIHV